MKRSTLTPWLGLPLFAAAIGTALAAQGCTADTSPPAGTQSSPLAAPFHSGGGHSGGIDPFGGSDGGSTTEGGGGSDSGYAYAFFEKKSDARWTPIELGVGLSKTISFSWHDAPGLAAPADMWVEAGGKTVLQVSSVGGAPFVRAGLEVVPLVPDATYDIMFSRGDDSVEVTILDATGNVMLRTETPSETVVANLALPGGVWRPSVVLQ